MLRGEVRTTDDFVRPERGGPDEGGKPLVDRGIPHAAIAAAFLASPESDRDEVEELYHRFLHRPADAAGLAGFVNALQAGATNEQIMAVLLGSDEYLQLTQR